jgi:subtilase family serine protease
MIRLRRPAAASAARIRSLGLAALATAWLGAGQAAELLSTHVPEAVRQHAAALVGRPDASQVLHVAIALPWRHQAELDRLLQQLYDPASPRFRHFLSAAEFSERFGPSAADYERAAQFFAQRGFTVTGTSANRYLIEADAPVAALERTLHLQLGLYRHPGEGRDFIAPDREPTLDLDIPVLHVVGLDDETLPAPRLVRRASAGAAASPVQGSAPGGWYLGSDIRAAYYGNGPLTGAGQSVGLMELAAYSPSGITTYFEQFGPPLTTQVVPISADGSTAPTCPGKCSDGEQALDIEYAIAMAPGLSQLQVYVARSPESVLNRMASDNTSAQLSTSWGWKESKAVDDPLFQEMAAQGQTFLTASGDYSTLRRSGPWPEESAYVTAVGGTDLLTNGPGGSWASESGWAHSAGGPSVDRSISIPAYQRPFINASSMGSKRLRNVPDVGGDADTVNYLCDSYGCSGGSGGTSFASPIWAGFIALANQQAAGEGRPRIGFLNPLVYGIGGQAGSYATAFHDTVGNTSGKYTAVAGFDLVTGLGSPNGQGLIDALVNPTGGLR